MSALRYTEEAFSKAETPKKVPEFKLDQVAPIHLAETNLEMSTLGDLEKSSDLEKLPQRDLSETASQSEVIRMDKFTVSLAGQEFVLPKKMQIDMFKARETDHIIFKFSSLYPERRSLNADLLNLTNRYYDLEKLNLDPSKLALERKLLADRIQKTQKSLDELEDIISRAEENWRMRHSLYLVNMNDFRDLLEKKDKEIEALYRDYDMALDEDKIKIEELITEAERELVYLREEYLSYRNLRPSIDGDVEVKNPLLAKKYIDKYPEVWEKDVEAPNADSEVEVSFVDQHPPIFEEIDMEQYVKRNKKSLEKLLQAKGELENYDLGMQENWWPNSVPFVIEIAGKEYSFDLAAYQRKRYKIFKRMEKSQSNLSELRAERDAFLKSDPTAQELLAKQQGAYRAWMEAKRRFLAETKQQEPIWRERLAVAMAERNKKTYYDLLAAQEQIGFMRKQEINNLAQKSYEAENNYKIYLDTVDNKMGVAKEEKLLENLMKDLEKLRAKIDNPAWQHMNLFVLAVEEAKHDVRL